MPTFSQVTLFCWHIMITIEYLPKWRSFNWINQDILIQWELFVKKSKDLFNFLKILIFEGVQANITLQSDMKIFVKLVWVPLTDINQLQTF